MPLSGTPGPALAASLFLPRGLRVGRGRDLRTGDPADLVVYGQSEPGMVPRPWASAVAVQGRSDRRGGRRRGRRPAWTGPATRVLNDGTRGSSHPGSRTRIPHFIDGGFQLASMDLPPATSPEDFIDRIKAYASERKPGEWILGGEWDHERWPGARSPAASR